MPERSWRPTHRSESAFKVVEMLGLGAIPADVKDRSLRIGASTEKALEMARDACNRDLELMVLPVLEPAHNEEKKAAR